MTLDGIGAAALERPGGESCGSTQGRPIDLSHLSRQTLGDREIEREVLALFVQQAMTVREKIGQAETAERLQLAHGLKGSARSVGAFAIADCVTRIETRPGEQRAIDELSILIEEVRDFIAATSR